MATDATTLNKAVNAVKKDKLSVAEIVYQNNPQATVKSMVSHGLLGAGKTDAASVSNALRLALYKGRVNTLRSVLSIVPFNTAGAKGTLNVDLWAALGLGYGDIAGLVNNYL